MIKLLLEELREIRYALRCIHDRLSGIEICLDRVTRYMCERSRE